MKLTKKQVASIEKALLFWTDLQLLDQETANQLRNSYEVVGFDWKRLAKYCFWVAIICIITAVSSVLADEALMRLLTRLFHAPETVKCLVMTGIAALLYYTGWRRRKHHPEKVFSSEAIFFLAVVATAGAVTFLGRAIDTGSGHFSLLILLATIIYAVLGLWFPSQLVWIFALLSLGSWMGTETGYISGWGAYYLGMNFPLRFVLFGLVLTAVSGLFTHWPSRCSFAKTTRIIALLNLFIALWIMSIFGNYGDMYAWQQARQIELFHWSVLFGAAAVIAIYFGIKEDDSVSRGFGLTFLFINLYTRFFEYFWDSTHKAIFFSLLAVSFWYFGSRAEKIWNFGDRQQHQSNSHNRTGL